MKGYLKSRTSERATFASQPSKPSNFRKPSKATKPTKDGKAQKRVAVGYSGKL